MSRLLIRASAGSGKTFRLTGHFLRQLFLGQRPETILATTFTRKAAGEILGRVLLRLADAAQDPVASEQLAAFLACDQVSQQSAQRLLAEVTRDLHRMRVCTLDSFFQLVARSLTLELGLPPGWSIIDDHVDREIRQQAIDAVLSQHVSRDAQQLMQMLAKGRSKRSIRDLIDETVDEFYELFLLTGRDAWHRFPPQHRLTVEERELAVRELYASELPIDKRAIAARAGDVERFQAGQWERFVTTGLAAKVFAGDPKYFGKPLADDLVQAYERMLQHARAELLDQVAQQTRATWELISRFDHEYSRLRSEHGWMRFSDVTRVLARTDHAADGQRMHFRLDSTIRHLLLDEFQDTSPDQWRILKRLAASIIEHSSESSFFCVGDGKQAIYGWRGGESAILDVVEQTIPQIEAQSLDQSRRSSPAVIQTVNRLFQNLIRHQNLDDYDTACAKWKDLFPEHATVHEQMPGFAQLRTSPVLEGESGEEQKAAWHRWVATQIRDLHCQCPGAEIGVLTRRNATVARLVHELTLLGVPASEEGGTPPSDSPAVLALLSLLHFASHPGCQVSRFHVAGSPLGPIVGLHSWNDSDMAVTVAARLRERLLDDGYGQTLQSISESIRSCCSTRDLLRLQQVVAAGWQFDQSPSLNSADFVRLLENSRFSRSEPAPVRVMTIHQSKGLEFPIVVLPELDGLLFRPPSAAAGSPRVGEPPDHVCVWRSKSLRPLLPEALQQAFDQTTASDVAEAMCLLYVAITRAMHSLQLLIPPVTAKKTPKTFAGLLVATLTDDQQAPENTVLYSTGDPEWFTHIPEFAVPQRNTPQKSAARQYSPKLTLAPMPDGRRRALSRRAPSRHDETRLYLPELELQQTREFSAVSAKVRGTLFHAWFECIEWLSHDTQPDPLMLRQQGEKKLALDETTINKLIPDFFKILKQPATRAALTKRNALIALQSRGCLAVTDTETAVLKVENERAFVLLQDSVIVQGTIDRLVLAILDGQVVAAEILDFKTDRLYGELPDWLQAKQSQYAPQLAEYRRAVQHCFRLAPENISARLLLLEADTVIDV